MLGGVLACVGALILGREAGRGLVDFSPCPHEWGLTRCCIVTFADSRASPLSCAQTGACGDEVSNLLLLQGCKETDECKENAVGDLGI